MHVSTLLPAKARLEPHGRLASVTLHQMLVTPGNTLGYLHSYADSTVPKGTVQLATCRLTGVTGEQPLPKQAFTAL